jgi:endonuclease/exonuclease/phosphatase family metal-dependent hydrolase
MAWLRRAATGALFAALLLGCATLSERPPIQCPPPGAQAGDLALVSWNIHGLPFPLTRWLAQRVDNVAAQVLHCGPDVVLLQEAWFEHDAAQLERRLGVHYARVVDASAVTDGAWFGIFGFRRGGLLAFIRSQENVVSEFEVFADTATAIRELDVLSSKGMQLFVLPGQRMTLVNTHLQAQYGPGKEYPEVRSKQIAQLLRRVEKLTGPAIVAGDFNTDAGDRLYGVLTGPLDDLTAGLRKREGIADRDWIDYVFATRGAGVAVAGDLLLRNVAPDDPFSDHNGIWLRVRTR